MKLSREQIDHISSSILTRLKEKKLIIFKADEETVLDRIRTAITDDIMAEVALDREVEALIERHSESAGGERVDHRKMFSMIKNKLARERELIL